MKLRHLLSGCVLALALAPSASAGTNMFVGAAEDQARSLDPVVAKSRMDLAALAGFDAVRMTTIWRPRQREIGGVELVALRNAAVAAQLDGIRLILSVYHQNRITTPLTPRMRADFAAFAASIARKVPGIDDFIIGNEPNLNMFWMPQFGPRGENAAAIGYERLLARTYDALKSVSPDINVIGGALAPRGQDKPLARRETHSPATFIPDLGKAYRKSGRRKRIMDMFATHPYLIPSRIPPTFKNPNNTTVALSDYDKLRKLLKRAFNGTAQPGTGLPILYDEFGYQSKIPAGKLRLYRHLKSKAAQDAISEARQAAQYERAFAIAQCQPTVAGILIFHVTDERDMNAWQSGVYYADRKPKSSLRKVRSAALRAERGSLVKCAKRKIQSGLKGVVFREPPSDGPTKLAIDFSCTSICRYEARVLRVDTGAIAAESSGTVSNGRQTASVPAEDLRPGTYQYAFRASSAGKAGTALTRYSRPFTIRPTEPSEPGADAPPAQEKPVPPPPEQPLAPESRLKSLSSLPWLPTLAPTFPPAADVR